MNPTQTISFFNVEAVSMSVILFSQQHSAASTMQVGEHKYADRTATKTSSAMEPGAVLCFVGAFSRHIGWYMAASAMPEQTRGSFADDRGGRICVRRAHVEPAFENRMSARCGGGRTNMRSKRRKKN